MSAAPLEARLTIAFTSWWLGGTGRSGDHGYDMIAYRDSAGCPALPMSQIKGLLRDTAAGFGLLDADHELLLGKVEQSGETIAAALRFAGDAAMDPADRAYFASDPAARAALFGVIRATAINDRGVARDESLRETEVAVPVTLTGRLHWIGTAPPQPGWVDAIDRLCALTPAFGKLRNDGIGRAIARCEAIQ